MFVLVVFVSLNGAAALVTNNKSDLVRTFDT